MQKRSHKLLAATLLENTQGFQARRFELAFLFGSFQPDCNPLTYLKGSLRAYKFRGHNYSNSQHYIYSRISRLQRPADNIVIIRMRINIRQLFKTAVRVEL